MLITCGINHKTASIALRERLAMNQDQARLALTDLMQQPNIQEAAILSTCNRSEIYCHSEHPDTVINWWQNYCATQDIAENIYLHQEQHAVEHMLRVASGLDSMILGEPQIFGQVKDAYHLARETGSVGKYLNTLFQYVFSITKQVRTHTGIGANPISVAFAVVKLAQQFFSDIASKHILLIGAGDTIQLVAKHLREAGAQRIIIANRSMRKASLIAKDYSAQVIPLSDISHYLSEVDVVVSATNSDRPIVGKGALETAFKYRKHKPLFIADLAIPRDIEPEVEKMQDVYLYTVDDLQGIVDNSLALRQAAARQAEVLVQQQSIEFMHKLKLLEAGQIVKHYRESMLSLRDMELAKALKKIENGIPAEYVLTEFSRSLTNKLIHTPSLRLKELSATDHLILDKLLSQLTKKESS